MSIDFDRSLQLLERSLDLRLRRHEILASNLANIDTPNYRARDLRFEGFLREAEGAPGQVDLEASAEVVEDPTPSGTLDGNNVDLDATAARLAENAVRYRAALELVRRKLALVRYGATMGQG